MGIWHNLSEAFRIGSNPSVQFSGSTQPEEEDLIAKSERAQDARAIVEDPLAIVQSLQYKDKPNSISYDTLRRMATRNSVVASIITTRVNQVSTFSQPARFSKDGIGFEISMRNPKLKPTKEQQELMMSIETFIENCGFSYNPSRDSFDTFLRKVTRDSLIYDQMCFEVVPDRLNRPAEILAVDASTIRAATVEPKKGNDYVVGTDLTDNNTTKWVQIINNTPVAEFDGYELAFAVRNPRTDINIQPYGHSELETLVQQVTSHLWAEEYNSRYFSQGGTTKGILNLKGQNISKEQLDAFRRQWTAQVAGVTGAWKTPVVSVDGLEYLNVSQSNREMEYEMWMNYLINICCAVYQIDPAEINFPNRGGSSGSGGGLGEGGIEDRLQNSKDKGLRPLLRFIESAMNRYIIRRFSNEFSFNFVGLDPERESNKQATLDKQIRTYRTINEVRRQNDLDPIEGGDIILDPTFTNNLMQEKQNAMMEEQAQGGDPSMGGDPSADPNGDPNNPEGQGGEPMVQYGEEGQPEASPEQLQMQQEDDEISQSIDQMY